VSVATGQLQLDVKAVGALAPPSPPSLPIDPRGLVDLPPLERGRYYNKLDLGPIDRACPEQALRLIAEGKYPGGGE
jgi:hypothetical protein